MNIIYISSLNFFNYFILIENIEQLSHILHFRYLHVHHLKTSANYAIRILNYAIHI